MRLIDTEGIRIKPEFMHDVCGVAMIRVEDIVRILNEQPTIEPEPHWILCSKRLPEEDTDILVTYVDGEEARIIPVNYGRGTWFDCIFNSALDSLKVIAWMPLPEPYREGD